MEHLLKENTHQDLWLSRYFSTDDQSELSDLLSSRIDFLLSAHQSILLIGHAEDMINKKLDIGVLFKREKLKSEEIWIQEQWVSNIRYDFKIHFLLLWMSVQYPCETFKRINKNWLNIKGPMFKDTGTKQPEHGEVSHQGILLVIIGNYLQSLQTTFPEIELSQTQNQLRHPKPQQNQKNSSLKASLKILECVTQKYRNYFLLQRSKDQLVIRSMKLLNKILNIHHLKAWEMISQNELEKYTNGISSPKVKWERSIQYMQFYKSYNRLCRITKKIKGLKTRQIKIDHDISFDYDRNLKIQQLYSYFVDQFDECQDQLAKKQMNKQNQSDSSDQISSKSQCPDSKQPIRLPQIKQSVLNVRGTLTKMSKMIQMLANYDDLNE